MFNFIFLSRFFTKMGCFCAHWTGNFLNFPKLTLLLFLVHFWCPLWPLNKDPPFFWDTLYMCRVMNLKWISSLNMNKYLMVACCSKL